MSDLLWKSNELSDALNVDVAESVQVEGVSIDSRTIAKSDLFVALKGENFDGHAYVKQSLNSGASCALVSQHVDEVMSEQLVHTDETLKGLEKLGVYRRKQISGKVIGVTGSVGKTSTKGMMAHALAACGKTHATLGNLNNHIGVPLTLSRMPRDTDYAVIEMGMNHEGEIAPLTSLARPHVAMVTTVESVHLEYFESEQEIAREKSQIFSALEPNGVAVLNRDNRHYDFMRELVKTFGVTKMVTFGKHAEADAKLLSYNENAEGKAEVQALLHGKKLDFMLGIIGEHQAVNALGVLASIEAAGVDVTKAAAALASYGGADGRGKVVEITLDGKRIDVMDDSYNASPASIGAGIHNLVNYAKRKGAKRTIAVLGDMFELGETAPTLHAELAQNIVESHVNLVFTAGDLMQHLYDALPSSQQGGHYKNAEETAAAIKTKLQEGDVLLVKGSRGMQMDKVVALLQQS